MSLMKRYADDQRDLNNRARVIAWNPNPETRLTLLDELFGDCAKASLVYHSPAEVTALFVHEVAETYTKARLSQRKVAA